MPHRAAFPGTAATQGPGSPRYYLPGAAGPTSSVLAAGPRGDSSGTSGPGRPDRPPSTRPRPAAARTRPGACPAGPPARPRPGTAIAPAPRHGQVPNAQRGRQASCAGPAEDSLDEAYRACRNRASRRRLSPANSLSSAARTALAVVVAPVAAFGTGCGGRAGGGTCPITRCFPRGRSLLRPADQPWQARRAMIPTGAKNPGLSTKCFEPPWSFPFEGRCPPSPRRKDLPRIPRGDC